MNNQYFDILGKVRDSLSEDGLFFECLELSINEGLVCGSRVYRNSHTKSFCDFDVLPKNIASFITKTYEENSDIRFFDYSERENGTFSVSFESRHNDVNFNVQNMPVSLENGIFRQIGYLVDRDGSVLCEKVYFNITENENIIGQIVDDNLLRSFCQCCYKPFLYGANIKDDSVENKVYFISKSQSMDRYSLDYATNIISVLKLDESVEDLISKLYDIGLWLKGFAISDGDVLRIYFFASRRLA